MGLPSRRELRGWGLLAVCLAALAGLLADVARADPKPGTAELQVSKVEVTAKPLAHFDRSQLQQKRFGKLEYRGGLVLSSDNTNFGGWSGLAIEPDGKRFVAVSDAGAWMTGEIAYDGARPQGLANVRIGPLMAVGNKPLRSGRDRDAEEVAFLDGNTVKGTILVGFERNHRIGRFDITNGVVGAPTGYLKMPPDARKMSANRGLEAVTALQAGPLKGSVLAFSERLYDKQKNHTGWLWVKGEPQALHLKDIDEFDLTGLAPLPDGGVILLERRFRWLEGVKMRLRRIAPSEIRAGGLITGEVLLQADMGYEIDNMEGVAVHKDARGETLITLISDDNFNHILQRNLLLQFALVETKSAAAPGMR